MNLFNKFNLCFSSNTETKNFLHNLGAKNVINLGNLKFSQSENDKLEINSDFKNFIKSKKIWCASSTHFDEENLCGLVHKKLKKKYKNLATVIIPRHIHRSFSIKENLSDLGLKVHLHDPVSKIKNDTDVYIVNSYGKTKSFYTICKNVFLGGSIINHGGQNPLEAARFGCHILHGPNVSNFKEVYSFLNKNKISSKINGINKMTKTLEKLFLKNKNSQQISQKINIIGRRILDSTYKKISLLLKNEI